LKGRKVLSRLNAVSVRIYLIDTITFTYQYPIFSVGDENAVLGSLGMITGMSMHGDSAFPDWLEGGVESSLRNTEDDVPVTTMPAIPVTVSSAQQRLVGLPSPVILTPGGGSSPVKAGLGNGGSKGPWTDLDRFYEDGNDEGDDEEESEDEEDENNLSEEGGSETEGGDEDSDSEEEGPH
jgi:AP-3 complex subunit beta